MFLGEILIKWKWNVFNKSDNNAAQLYCNQIDALISVTNAANGKQITFAVQIYLKRSGYTIECCGQKDKNFRNNLYKTNYWLFEIHVHSLVLLVKGFSLFQQQGSEPEKQANKHTEAHQITLSCTDCHVWAFRLRFPWHAAFVKIDRGDAHHCQIPNMTDWQIKKHCPPRGNGERVSPSARNANHLPKKCLVSDSTKQSCVPALHMNAANHPQIMTQARWDERVIGAFLCVCLSLWLVRKLSNPETFFSFRAWFFGVSFPSEENKEDSVYLLIYSLLSLKNQQTLGISDNKTAK